MRTHTKAVVSLAAVGLLGMLAIGEARADGDDVEAEGAITEMSGTCPNLRFKIGPQVITTNAETEFDDGDCAEVKNGARVEVEGHRGPDGVLTAEEVDLNM